MSTSGTTTAAPQNSAAAEIHEITNASKEIFEAGERIATNLDRLEQRVEYAMDWKARLAERPWLIVGGAILGGILLWRLFKD